jgi:hypothetical protein
VIFLSRLPYFQSTENTGQLAKPLLVWLKHDLLKHDLLKLQWIGQRATVEAASAKVLI